MCSKGNAQKCLEHSNIAHLWLELNNSNSSPVILNEARKRGWKWLLVSCFVVLGGSKTWRRIPSIVYTSRSKQSEKLLMMERKEGWWWRTGKNAFAHTHLYTMLFMYDNEYFYTISKSKSCHSKHKGWFCYYCFLSFSLMYKSYGKVESMYFLSCG